MREKSFLSSERMHLMGLSRGKSWSFQTVQKSRLLALSQIFSRSLLTLDLVYHQTKALRTLTRERGSRGQCLSAWTFADARHARIRRLAPCLRRHLPDDGWFEFVRRIYRRIAENPWIPPGKNGLSLIYGLPLRLSQTKERSARRSSIDLRYFSTTCLPWHAGKKRGRNLNRALRALTLDYVSYIRGSSKFNSWYAWYVINE